jgi:acyl-CoA thioester hydrolase
MFHFPIRIYYEDTDAGGVVYYANYLKYLERCRTEWLRRAGFDQSLLLREHQLGFVVRRVEADYLRPAILDDQLEVGLRVEKLGAAQIVFAQTVSRRDASGAPELLLSARVQIVSVNMNHMRPAPIPAWMKTQLQEATEQP